MPKQYTEEELIAHAQKVRDEISANNAANNLNEYELETACLNACGFTNPLRPIFLMEMMRMQWQDDALIWSVEKDGIQNEWAYRMVRRLCKTRFPSLMGAGSAAKSYVAAAYCYTAWKAKPWCTSIFFSTTSGEAAEQRGWGYIKGFHRADKYKVGQLLEYKRSIVLEENKVSEKSAADRDFTNSIHLVLIKPGNEGDNALSAISGRKNEIVIWLKDESQLMTNDTTLAEANLCTNPFCQIIDIGNAPREGTQFYTTAMPYGPGLESGYKAIDMETMDGWPTQSGYCEWFDGEKSPNIIHGKNLFRGIITSDSIREIEKRCGGRDTPGYSIQVRGFPPSVDIQDTVLTKDLIRKNLADQPAIWAGVGPAPLVLGGGDLGFREDGDPCTAHFGMIGGCSDGKIRLEVEPHTVIIAPSSQSKLPFEDQIALRYIEECDSRGCREFQLDITGDGGIILSRCIFYARGRINFVPKSFGGTPDETAIGGGDDRKCKDVYDRMVTQLWYGFRMAVQNDQIRGMSLQSKSTDQGCSRRVRHQGEGKKIAIETKKEMKKRIKRSPDDFDSTVNLHDRARAHGLAATQEEPVTTGQEEEEAPVADTPYTESGFSSTGYQASNRSRYASR
ncbi:MAG TPA: hypothetical protein VMQ76_12675 [Terracidiphilus sp.]|nr:hypothetical protein [Terracidiphilus sp.]